MKIFIIGFNKCGTRTLHHFFSQNGLSCIHWDDGKLAKQMKKNVIQKKPILRGYAHINVFSDMEFIHGKRRVFIEGYKWFKKLDAQFPNSKFILNTRNVNNWIKSRCKHKNGQYIEEHKKVFGVKQSKELTKLWKKEWTKHHQNVLAHFRNRPETLCVFNIETDNVHKLIDFFQNDINLDPQYYRHLGKT